MAWKERFKQFGVPGLILLLIISLFSFYLISNDTELLKDLHKEMSKFITADFLKYHENESPLLQALQFILLILIYGLFLVGFVNAVLIVKNVIMKKSTALLLRKIDDYDSYLDLEDKLGDVLTAFDQQSSLRVIDEKVTIFMMSNQAEIKRIFDLPERQIEFVWYFEGKNNDIKLVYLKTPTDIEGAAKLINSALDMPNVRVQESAVNSRMELRESPIKQFITVRNYGNLKLGLAVFILKDNIFTNENLKEFTYYTSKMILLGTNNRFLRQFKRKKNAGN
ncbi:hypothetical protein BGM26_16510 [Bacillus sp. FJAT-29790]|uniref:hypothetical protein n=1 Tax=Bacillus sp. FJAT-29790 TaxID=1895002 RepID=UPI001C22425B|nr:hypothetical protein [Bacillus sp. FJAT-29790]MBU8880558.1 hypothetical protein [Bacillus sp. FJAT-29790]